MRTRRTRFLILATLALGACEEDPFEPPAKVGALGACCTADACDYLGQNECEGLFIKGEQCEPDPCPSNLTACCADDGTCSMRSEFACNGVNGNSMEGLLCDPNPCDQPARGACCSDLGECSQLDVRECRDNRWTFIGDGTMCAEDTCPDRVVGACCNPDGSCVFTDESRCDRDLQVDVMCDPNPCEQPAPGACCANDSTECSQSDAYACRNARFHEGEMCSEALCVLPVDAGPDAQVVDAAPDMSVPVDMAARPADMAAPPPDMAAPPPDMSTPDGPPPDAPIPDAQPLDFR